MSPLFFSDWAAASSPMFTFHHHESPIKKRPRAPARKKQAPSRKRVPRRCPPSTGIGRVFFGGFVCLSAFDRLEEEKEAFVVGKEGDIGDGVRAFNHISPVSPLPLPAKKAKSSRPLIGNAVAGNKSPPELRPG